jgi:hypothetical protein
MATMQAAPIAMRIADRATRRRAPATAAPEHR